MQDQIIDTICLFGLDFQRATLDEAALKVIELANTKKYNLIVTPNVDHIVNMGRDPEMKSIFETATYRFADGMPIVWFSKIFKHRLPERVTGADLLIKIAELSTAHHKRLYFMGGLPGVAEKAASRLRSQYPGLEVCGTYCPPFGFELDRIECEKIIQDINNALPDILFIGVGAPKQEKWAYHHRSHLAVGPVLGVGAAFDFVAGTQTRAPLLIQKSGLEWAWRLASEPRRLWKRYLISDATFLLLVIKELISIIKRAFR